MDRNIVLQRVSVERQCAPAVLVDGDINGLAGVQVHDIAALEAELHRGGRAVVVIAPVEHAHDRAIPAQVEERPLHFCPGRRRGKHGGCTHMVVAGHGRSEHP